MVQRIRDIASSSGLSKRASARDTSKQLPPYHIPHYTRLSSECRYGRYACHENGFPRERIPSMTNRRMEESIKKAEELIEATNAELARIQCDSSLDDFTNLLKGFREGDRKNRALDNARRVLSPTEKTLETNDAFNLNKHSIRNDKIEEINNKIEAYKLERESEKAMTLDVPLARPKSDTNLSRRTVTKMNLTEDLKAKLQETQDVVNRGIQAARELSETVEVLRSGRQTKSDPRESSSPNKSESVSTVKTTDGKRCKRCNAEITRKTKSKHRKKEDNVLVTRVKGTDASPPGRRHNLNYQQLPSLKIQGDLTCQRIPSVDIPPGRRESFPRRANAAYEMYSHDEIVSDKIISGIKASNNFIPSGSAIGMECSNCGKVVRMCDKSVRPEQIDELLKICDYNVFDPRIDEFVERNGGKMPEEAKYTQTEMETTAETPKPLPPEGPKRRIRNLSSELTRKYREKATEMERDHLEFEGILRELFEKMDESRALFKSCDYLNTIAGKRKASLSATPPVLLSYTGSGEEADDGRNAVFRPSRTKKSKLPSKAIRKKLERKELEINCKLISSSCPAKGRTVHAATPTPTVGKRVSDDAEISLSDRELPKNHKTVKPSSPSRGVAVKPTSPVISTAESILSPPQEVRLNAAVEESVKQTNTVSDYESDFEEETLEEKSPEQQQGDDNSYKYNARLSTISEVDSELDRKMSDLAITSEERRGKEDPKPSSSSSDEDDTRKLLKNVNRDLEIASQQLLSTKRGETLKKVPEDVAEPLKEVLNALKDQFERTELLADRLTESIKEVNKPEEGHIPLSNGHRDLVMVNNLQRTRKIAENGKSSSPRSNVLRGLRERGAREKGSTRDEVLSPSGSVGSKGSVSTGKSYSEGEISELEVLVSGRSSPSIGEVITEHSDGSLSDEKSVTKFL